MAMRGLVFLLGACLLGAQTPAPSSQNRGGAAPAGDAGAGRILFDRDGCYECHGHLGQGGAGARIAPNPIPFAAFSKYVRQPAGEMPPYTAKVVSDRDLANIYAFLQSIPARPGQHSCLEQRAAQLIRASLTFRPGG